MDKFKPKSEIKHYIIRKTLNKQRKHYAAIKLGMCTVLKITKNKKDRVVHDFGKRPKKTKKGPFFYTHFYVYKYI